ncbi:hypothetical protein AOG2_10550 [Geobacter sp. AOG2]|nr:hypothetical protein AOG2_10550 [Geobacter sp. AOG2]
MTVFFSFIYATGVMLGLFILAFVGVYLLALLLFPIERKVSSYIWSHPMHATTIGTHKGSFKKFSQRIQDGH